MSRTITIGTSSSDWRKPHVSGHTIQRIAGLALSYLEPMPLYANDGIPGTDSLVFDEPVILPEPDDRTPLDRPVPDDITLSDHDLPLEDEDPYDGFPNLDFDPQHRLPQTKRSRALSKPAHVGEHADLERMADQILAAEEQGLLRTIKPMRVAGLPDVDDNPRWTYRPYTYTLGWKDCPRCHGAGTPFGAKPCSYCHAQGGWAITRTRMTPWHPEHGWAPTPPRLDGKPVHTTHWRTRSPEYLGDVRTRIKVRPSSAIDDEIRRRYFQYKTRRELQKLVTIDQTAAQRSLAALAA